MVPTYATKSLGSSIVLYKVEHEYNTHGLQYIESNINDVGKANQKSYGYAYGILSPINYSKFVVLDIDKMPQAILIYDKNKVPTRHVYNIISFISKIPAILKAEFPEIKRIDIMCSSILSQNAFAENYKVRKYGLHIYIEFNDVYNVEAVYKNYIVCQFMCRGYLTFLTYNGYSNIRISNKFNVPESTDNIIKDTTITPVASYVNDKFIKYPRFLYLDKQERLK